MFGLLGPLIHGTIASHVTSLSGTIDHMDDADAITDADRIAWLYTISWITHETDRLEVERLIEKIRRRHDHKVEMAKALHFI